VDDSINILRQIDDDQELSALLADVFEFDVKRKVSDGSPGLASEIPLEAVAGDFTGGIFYLCGTVGSPRPVLYASSEGDAGPIAADLREALTLMVGFPYWRDLLKYSANGNLDSMKVAMEFLSHDIVRERPTIGAEQSQVARSLGLALEAPLALVFRLHAMLQGAGAEFVFSDSSGEYGSLFGRFSADRNRRWR
jgi:hypothetical protein